MILYAIMMAGEGQLEIDSQIGRRIVMYRVYIFRLAYKPHIIPLWGFCPVKKISVFRLAYKPHSVRRLIPVYANGFIPDRAPVRSSL